MSIFWYLCIKYFVLYFGILYCICVCFFGFEIFCVEFVWIDFMVVCDGVWMNVDENEFVVVVDEFVLVLFVVFNLMIILIRSGCCRLCLLMLRCFYLLMNMKFYFILFYFKNFFIIYYVYKILWWNIMFLCDVFCIYENLRYKIVCL